MKNLEPKNYNERYVVHPCGKVWRNAFVVFRNNQWSSEKFPVTIKAGWVSTRVRKAGKGHGGGYEFVDLDKTWLMHRLVATLFIPNPDNLSDVNHKDGDRTNNCVSNLEWVSRSDNQKHAYSVLKRVRKAKLTDKEILEVARLRNEEGLSLKEIGSMFNIAFQTVSEIARGKRFIFKENDLCQEK